MPVKEYDLREFFAHVVRVLEELDIPYMVVGGFAAIVYGEPRLTIDVDVVVDMKLEHVKPFVEAFPIPDYYASEEGIRDSLRRRFPFNVIQPFTGAKVDLTPLPSDVFSRMAFLRRQRVEYDRAGNTAYFITPEDVIIAKLLAHKNTGSEKHLRDVRGVLVMQEGYLDVEAVRRGAGAAGVLEQLEEMVKSVQEDTSGDAHENGPA